MSVAVEETAWISISSVGSAVVAVVDVVTVVDVVAVVNMFALVDVVAVVDMVAVVDVVTVVAGSNGRRGGLLPTPGVIVRMHCVSAAERTAKIRGMRNIRLGGRACRKRA